MGYFAEAEEWKDIEPIPHDEGGPNALAAIAYSDEYAEAMSYLRAVMAKNEMSDRAIGLTNIIISANPAHYTVWLYRAKNILSLNKDLRAEIEWLNETALQNLKNYQLWHYRQTLVDKLDSAEGEQDFIARILAKDAKNYHVWSYRQWLVRRFDLWDQGELEAVERLLAEDVRNNSAWNHRWFLAFGRDSNNFSNKEILDRELDYAKAAVHRAPQNESPWNYLRGLVRHAHLPLNTLKDFASSFADPHKPDDVRSSHALDLLADIYATEDGSQDEVGKALDLLATRYDPIRQDYWNYRKHLATKMNGHAVDLPKGDSPTLAVVQPTDEEKLLQWTKNGASWMGALSLEAYLRREEHLARQDFTKEGGITYWVLVDTAAKERVVLAGCETYRKKAVVAQGGKAKDVITHGVGSVFSPPQFRGRGYAARMMQELGNKLRTWQSEYGECQFSVLWSDIGKKFYAAHGWEPFPSAHISLPASAAAGEDGTLPPVRELYPADLADLCAADEALLRKFMQERAADGKTHVAILPKLEKIQWYHAREEFVGKEFYGRVPEVKGAIVGDEEGKRVWCYWTRMWYNPDAQQDKDNTLHILRLVIEEDVTPDAVVPAITTLLAKAQREATGWHMAEVETWTPSPEVVAAARSLDPKAEVINRDNESIASLRWYGDSPSNGGSLAEAIEWVGNEKYSWC